MGIRRLFKEQSHILPRISKIMKKNVLKIFIFLIPLTFWLFLGPSTGAATTPTPTTASLETQINDLKNKIASRVAELKLVEKKGIIGTVTDSSDTQITLSDLTGNTRFVDVDELTKFSSSLSKSFGISDVEKGQTLGVLGLYNKQSRRILAREVNVLSKPPKIIYGGISVIDNKNFEITIVKENGQKVVVSVENVTKTYSYSDGELTKSGFSKINVAQTIIVIGLFDKNDPDKILATRIILFPDIDISSKINLAPSSPTIVPSTGSGKKLTPITK